MTHPHTLRCFVALTLSESARASLADIQQRLRDAGPRVAWESPEKLHVTVRFLGPTTEDARRKLEELLSAEAKTVSPFDLVFHELGAFPDANRPRVIWAGAFPTEAVMNFGTKMETLCRSAGWTPEARSFHAHCTLARVKGLHGALNLTEALKSITFDPVLHRANDVVLMKSDLLQGGSQYTTLASFPFHRFRSSP